MAIVYSIMFWGIERANFFLFFTLFSLAFLFHLYPFYILERRGQTILFICTGLLIKVLAVIAIPTLSEDIYRYIWDGYLSHEGISPYAYTPDECIKIYSFHEHPILHSLYPDLNSTAYYSVYPAAAQVFFSLAGWIAASFGISAAIIGLKTIFLMTECLGWYFLYQLFQTQKTDQKWFWALWLNPLLILEWNFSGHIESLAAAFIIGSVFMIKMKNQFVSGTLLALAVLVKLWPLIFAPFFVKYLKSKQERIKWMSAFVFTGIIGSIPIIYQSEYFIHFISSLDLYLRSFEFNASIYYIFRAIGTWWYGYNPIHMTGPLCTILMLGICIWIYIKRSINETRQLLDAMLIISIAYLLFATTVHPWYLSILIPFAYLNARWSVVLWSYLIFASYLAYQCIPVTENITLLIFTYSIVSMAILIDWKGNKNVIVS